MNLSFFIARRYIVSKKSNNAINIISWISVFAIAVGVGALVIVLTGMNGLTSLVESLYNSFDPDIEITAAKGKVINLDENMLKKVRSIKNVKYVSYSIEDNALVKYNDRQTLATIKGVSENFIEMSRFDTLVFEGKFVTKNGKTSFGVFGKAIAYYLGVNMNDVFTPISIYSPTRGKVSSLNPEDAFNETKVYASGLFAINDEFDYKYILIDIEQARELFGYTNEVSAIELGLVDKSLLSETQKEIKTILNQNFLVKNKFQQNDLLFKTLESEKLWTFIILVFILVIATFNIIGALTMLIIEKKKDIHILTALGADMKLIRKIFMTEGFLITVIGASLGLIIGFTLCIMQVKFGLLRFEEGYIVEYYPMQLMISDFFAIIAVVMVIGFFSAWYPVRTFTQKSLSYDDTVI